MDTRKINTDFCDNCGFEYNESDALYCKNCDCIQIKTPTDKMDSLTELKESVNLQDDNSINKTGDTFQLHKQQGILIRHEDNPGVTEKQNKKLSLIIVIISVILGAGILLIITHDVNQKPLPAEIASDTQEDDDEVENITDIYIEPQLISVENVAGEEKTEAIKILENQGLTVEFHEVFNNDVTPGHVISQRPNAGHQANPNSAVILQVSRGPRATGLVFDPAGERHTGAGFFIIWYGHSRTLSVDVTPSNVVAPIVWDSNDPSVVQVIPSDCGRTAELHGLQVGEARVSVTAGGRQSSMIIWVQDDVPPFGSELRAIYDYVEDIDTSVSLLISWRDGPNRGLTTEFIRDTSSTEWIMRGVSGDVKKVFPEFEYEGRDVGGIGEYYLWLRGTGSHLYILRHNGIGSYSNQDSEVLSIQGFTWEFTWNR